MGAKFHGTDNKLHSMNEVKRKATKIYYWIIFPQGVCIKHNGYTDYSSMMTARTLSKAKRLATKHNAAYIDRMADTPFGRFTIKTFGNLDKDYDELWNEYQKLPEIIIDKKLVL